jgi:hypothetical protein
MIIIVLNRSFCTNLGFNPSSPSGANAGCVVLRARLRTRLRAHQVAGRSNYALNIKWQVGPTTLSTSSGR